MPVRPVTGRCLFAGSDKRSLLELSHALGCKVSVHLQCSCDFFCHCDLSVIPQMPSVSDSEIHLSSLKVVHGKGVCHIRVPFSAGGLIHSTVESSRCLPCGITCCNLQCVVMYMAHIYFIPYSSCLVSHYACFHVVHTGTWTAVRPDILFQVLLLHICCVSFAQHTPTQGACKPDEVPGFLDRQP